MNTEEIAEIVRRISEDVRAQMDPLMSDLFEDALIHGVAMIRTTDEGVIERVAPNEFDLVDLPPKHNTATFQFPSREAP